MKNKNNQCHILHQTISLGNGCIISLKYPVAVSEEPEEEIFSFRFFVMTFKKSIRKHLL